MKLNILKNKVIGILFASSVVLCGCTDLDEKYSVSFLEMAVMNSLIQRYKHSMVLSTTVSVICTMVGRGIWILARNVETCS